MEQHARQGSVLSRRQFSAMLGSAVLAGVFAQAHAGSAYAAESGKIAIIHTNDVHCAIDPATDKSGNQTSVGYAGVSRVYKDAQEAYGADNTILVDAGDWVQGQSTGTLTKGSALVALMNQAGYSYAALGNHDFDFGVEQLMALTKASNHQTLCCNFVVKKTGENPYKPFAIKEMAGKKVAFLGIATPETLRKTNPTVITDDQGNYLIGFHEDDTGQALYDCVQSAVDQARAQGADFVVGLAHLGQTGVDSRWRSDTMVANTSGIDVLIDGHSHECYVQNVKNKNGQDVVITQAGTILTAVGRMIIDTTTSPATITAESVLPPVEADPAMAAAVAAVNSQLESVKGRVIAKTAYSLRAFEDDNYTWAVRAHETNLGDLVTDAYRARMGADIALCNGGGIRADVPAGNITFGQAIDVNPFSNNLCLIKAKGSTVLDGLEFDFRNYPKNGFDILQVSGVSFEVRTDIASTVEVDSAGNFVKVAGARRIQNVKVGGVALDPDAEYTVASSVYILVSGGNGRTMWKDSQVLVAEGVVDFQALSDYLEQDLAGAVGDDYANATGAGRIVAKDGPDPTPQPSPTPDPTPASNTSGGSTSGGFSSGSSASTSAKTGDGLGAVVTTAVAGAFVAAAALGGAASAE